MHCGHERAEIAGLFVAGACFVFPAVVITGGLAWFYTFYGQLPEVTPFISGIKPAVLAIILSAILKLGKKALKNWELGTIGILVLIFSLLGVNEVIALLNAGIFGILYFYSKSKLNTSSKSVAPFFILKISTITFMKLSSIKVLWTFFKVGAILYGSGPICTRSCFIYCNLYWLSINRILGSHSCYDRNLSSFFSFCTTSLSVSTQNEKIKTA